MATLTGSARVCVRRIAACACAAVLAAGCAFPSLAFAAVTVDGTQLSEGENAVGGGTATWMNQTLDMVNVVANNVYIDEDATVNFKGGNDVDIFTVGGDAQVQVDFTNQNSVEDTFVQDNATVTINADGHNNFEEVNASDNANVTVNVAGENSFESFEGTDNATITIRGVTCQMRDVVNVSQGDFDEAITTERGTLTLSHITLNLMGEENFIGSKAGNVVIDTSKIAHAEGNVWAEIVAGGTMLIRESVIDITGTIFSEGLMTIDHSNVSVDKSSEDFDSRPYRVFSKTGIQLIRQKNGAVKDGEYNGAEVKYVDTGDDGDGMQSVNLQADGMPAYYRCKPLGAPNTGDSSQPFAPAALALVGATTAGYALKRRRENA